MGKTIITEAMALDIVSQFITDITKIDTNGILAVYVIGSLGGGYYRPGQSDIDTIILVRNGAVIGQEQIDAVAAEYWHKFDIPKGFGSIMIHENELYPPYERSKIEDFEFSIEIVRLKKQGKAVYRTYDLMGVPMPGRDDLICDAIIMENWLNKEFGYPMFDKLKMTGCINCILGSMRRYLMIERGIYEFNKFKTIDCYLQNSPPLVDANLFTKIQDFLYDKISDDEELLHELQQFGIRMRDYLNRKLLNIGFDE